jgi:putative transposase
MQPHNGRKSLRLKTYDYSQAGAYFITICTHEKKCLFGYISNRQMNLNGIGRIVENEWVRTASLRANVELDVFAIMPNHIHGIIIINNNKDYKSEFKQAPTSRKQGIGSIKFKSPSKSVGAIVKGFKSATTGRVKKIDGTPGKKLWQRNYWERVIRNEFELQHIRKYIQNNPINWELDKLHPMNCTH